MFLPGTYNDEATNLFHQQVETTYQTLGDLEPKILQLSPEPLTDSFSLPRLVSQPVPLLTPPKKGDPQRTGNEKVVTYRPWKDLIFGMRFLLGYDRSGPTDYAFDVAVGMWLRNTGEDDLISASLVLKRRTERQGKYLRESLWITLENNRLPDPAGGSLELYWETDGKHKPSDQTAELRLKTMESPVGQEVTTDLHDVWRKARNDLLTTHRLLWPSFKPA